MFDDKKPVSAPAIPVIPATKPITEIHTIPDKFYGAALKQVVKPKEAPKPIAIAPPKNPNDPNIIIQPARNPAVKYIALAIVVLVLGSGGGFAYYNRAKFFAKPVAPSIPVAPSVQSAPNAPTNLVATSSNSASASLSWVDIATDESGYRVERSERGGPFTSLTNLPPNSASFLDVSVQGGHQYTYRVFAMNEGGDSASSADAYANVPAPVALAPTLPPVVTNNLPPAGLDADADGLSDKEEKLMGSDMHNPDTDGDGFLDGNEVFNLYNATTKAPGKLIDAGLVVRKTGSVGWEMQVPAQWHMALDNANGMRATIATEGPEKFTFEILPNVDKLNLVDWYVAKYPRVDISELRKFISKKGYEGIIGPDLLTTYIPWGNYVVAMTYDLKGEPFINYRTLYSMMLNSLALNGLPVVVNSGTPLPFEPAATVPGIVNQPVSIEAGAAAGLSSATGSATGSAASP